MNDKELFGTIIKTITPYVKDLALLESATADTRLIQDLKINSARLVDIVIVFEDVFDIEIGDDDVDSIKTIGQLMTVILKKTEGAAA
ncbi:MAG: phosphopantetheine-binding protein [Desulfobacteraceae bacterium]|jgi:acyl carrier protein